MQPYDACRLMCLNLFSIVKNPFTDEAKVDYDMLYELSYAMQTMADDLVDLEIEAIEKIIQKIKTDPQPEEEKTTELNLWEKIKDVASSGRRTGNGFTGLGDMFAALGHKYDSEEAMKVTEIVMKVKMKGELNATIDMAEKFGPFKGWSRNKEYGLDDSAQNMFYAMLANEFPEEVQRMKLVGRRNISWSTVAPTGSVSILAEVTSGLEPMFMPYYIRKKKVNPGDKDVRVDSTDQNGDCWQHYAILHPKFEEWYYSRAYTTKPLDHNIDREGNISICPIEEYDENGLQTIFTHSPWYGSAANDINWIKRVELQSIIQRYTTHSISSTINLPENITKEEVSEIYLESYHRGLKGVTVYRDGSRTGVLTAKDKKDQHFTQNKAPKRPEQLECNIHQTTYEGNKWLVVVGLLENKPYEVFCIPNHYDLSPGTIPGTLTKKDKGRYFLFSPEKCVIENIVKEMTDEQEAITRLISTSLRHGTSIKYIVEQLGKTSGGITAFSTSISRVLKSYIPEGEKSSLTFEDCNKSECNVVFEEGCVKCTTCGKSKC